MLELPVSSAATTQLLNRLHAEGFGANEELLRAVYAELHRLAAHHMARQPAVHTLQPTALVHEAWMRLVDQKDATFESRGRFFALASRVMRSLLVDHARRRAARPHEGAMRITLNDEATAGETAREAVLLDLDEALEDLGRTDEELLRVVELRFFGGLTAQEAANALEMPLRSYERSYQVARLWLQKRLSAKGSRSE